MKNIDRVLNKDYVKCHYPFFWLVGNETEQDIVKALERVKKSGCDGVTVEPRGFKDFEVQWWKNAEIILKKCKELGMKVVFVDEDSSCPSGHAFAAVNKPEYAHLRRSSLVEQHLDVIGPITADYVVGKTFPWSKTINEDKLLGCYAYRRVGDRNDIDFDTAIDLTNNIKNGILSCSLPEGNFRIMYVIETMKFSEMKKDDYVDVLNPESVDLVIKLIYEKYEQLFSEYFGETLVGFFSDEPFIGNAYVYCGNTGHGAHEDTRVGHLGITMPVNPLVKERLHNIYGDDYVKYIPSLWYNGSVTPKFRNDYMNIVADLYSESFSQRIGKWCNERGLIYMGHVLEDNNLHSRVGDGPGHYFRSQEGQSMPGIDIVLHQIMPGFADINLGAYGANLYDNEFYHYILGKLNSSAAHTYEAYNGKAMCEVTIGYGWAEGAQLAKWLFDYLLVRGTNYFVPGAIRPVFPDRLHAPHWGDNDGKEPQFDGYSKILSYSKKVLTALDKTEHKANAAILYHAQAEWMSGFDYTLMQAPAKVLYDNHIDFDILSEDLLDKVSIENGKIKVIEQYDCLVVPYAKLLPENLINQLAELKAKGADVIFTDALPENCNKEFTTVKLNEVANYFKDKGYVDISIDGAHLLRHYHAVDCDGKDVYMFFNESTTEVFDGIIRTGKTGNYNVYDFITDVYGKGNGDIRIRLEPYQSCIVTYEDDRGFDEYVNYDKLKKDIIKPEFNVKCYSYNDMETCVSEYNTTELKPISASVPEFSGKIEYRAEIDVKAGKKTYLKLGNVGETAEVYLNGKNCGIVICNPFVFDITNAVKEGKNDLYVKVYTTLANDQRDPISMFVPLAPTGISGEVEILSIK